MNLPDVVKYNFGSKRFPHDMINSFELFYLKNIQYYGKMSLVVTICSECGISDTY